MSSTHFRIEFCYYLTLVLASLLVLTVKYVIDNLILTLFAKVDYIDSFLNDLNSLLSRMVA